MIKIPKTQIFLKQFGAIQLLRNARGVDGVKFCPKKCYATVELPPYRVLQGVGGSQILSKKALSDSWMAP